jgi:8-amino-7-oxononanoate synthase
VNSLDQYAARKLASLEARALKRTLVEGAREDGIWVKRDGRRLLSFSCNDYLNLSQHPAVKRAAIEAIEIYGTGAGASRLITGNHPLYAELEAKLARLKAAEAACVFGSGYLANTGIVPALLGGNDAIFVDSLAHSCIGSGAELSGARVHAFAHNDVDDLRRLLAGHRAKHRNALIVTEGVFSMDGDLAPLPALAALAKEHEAWLMTDDAHGIGVLGRGRGSTFAFAPKPDVPLQMGTLSKAIGGYGGYLCASREVIDFIKSRARTLIYSTALPPASVAAAIAALDVIEDNPTLTEAPLRNARRFTGLLNLPEAQSPIVPLVIGGAEDALAASKALEREGFLVTAIRPPTVPLGTARLRFTFTAAHEDDDIVRLTDTIRRSLHI